MTIAGLFRLIRSEVVSFHSFQKGRTLLRTVPDGLAELVMVEGDWGSFQPQSPGCLRTGTVGLSPTVGVSPAVGRTNSTAARPFFTIMRTNSSKRGIIRKESNDSAAAYFVNFIQAKITLALRGDITASYFQGLCAAGTDGESQVHRSVRARETGSL